MLLGVAPQRTLIVVTETHGRFYLRDLGGLRADAVVVQPENRGTAPAVLYALLRLAKLALRDSVAFFPAYHYVSDDRRLMSYVDVAFEANTYRPDLVTLLGVVPHGLNAGGDGWIEPGEPLEWKWTRPLSRTRLSCESRRPR